MLSSLLILFVCVLFIGAAFGDSLRSEPRELNGADAVEEPRELQQNGYIGYIGKRLDNKCTSVFPGSPVIKSQTQLNGQACKAPCNNPCLYLSNNGCGAGQYCSCGGSYNKPVTKCLMCPYITAKGTTCPGDGFVYDKSFPAPAPIANAPTRPPVKSAGPQCYGSSWGACVAGQYCHLKSTDWTHVCTECPRGLVCRGDGTRVSPPPPPAPVRGPK